MQLGKLTFIPIVDNAKLTAEPIQTRVGRGEFTDGVYVAPIDPTIADTASFCETYAIPPELSANCIVVEAKRGQEIQYAACLILATDMIDINSKVRHFLDARKASFAPKDATLAMTNMEYGGITPLGLPANWQILIDEHVAEQDKVVIGGGLRSSKILVRASVLVNLPGATVLDIAK